MFFKFKNVYFLHFILGWREGRLGRADMKCISSVFLVI